MMIKMNPSGGAIATILALFLVKGAHGVDCNNIQTAGDFACCMAEQTGGVECPDDSTPPATPGGAPAPTPGSNTPPPVPYDDGCEVEPPHEEEKGDCLTRSILFIPALFNRSPYPPYLLPAFDTKCLNIPRMEKKLGLDGTGPDVVYSLDYRPDVDVPAVYRGCLVSEAGYAIFQEGYEYTQLFTKAYVCQLGLVVFPSTTEASDVIGNDGEVDIDIDRLSNFTTPIKAITGGSGRYQCPSGTVTIESMAQYYERTQNDKIRKVCAEYSYGNENACFVHRMRICERCKPHSPNPPTDGKCYVDTDYGVTNSNNADGPEFLRAEGYGGREYHVGDLCSYNGKYMRGSEGDRALWGQGVTVCCEVENGLDRGAETDCVPCGDCQNYQIVNDACCAWHNWENNRNGGRRLNGVFQGGCIDKDAHGHVDGSLCCKCSDDNYICVSDQTQCDEVCLRRRN